MTDFDLTIIKTVLEHQKDNIEDVVVINKGMSNGDVIKAIFPKDVKVITQHDDIFGRRFIDLRVGQLDCELDDDWWNAPYQKGGKVE